jgi:hypothetical protein
MCRVFNALVLALFAANANAATFTIRSTDAAGVGFNDTTPFSPVGGNNATTLGQARMNVLLEAARIWGSLIQSNVPILVDASFDALTCSALSATLGSAGPRSVFRNVTGGASAEIYYVSALADAISGSNRSSNPTSADIVATFSSALDNNPSCLNGRGFYYGFDHNKGGQFDLLLVVLHELGHGLGFTSQVDLTTGKGFIGSDNIERFDSFTHKLFDEQFDSVWPALTDAQRVQSATHSGTLAWAGANANGQSSRFTQGVTAGGRVRLYAPTTLSSGSSVSHWDTAVTPSVLMEPNLPASIITSSTDITPCALQDIGWTVNQCPHNAINHAPSAIAQSITLMEDTSITITLNGVDADNDLLQFAVATMPAQGTLSAISTTVPHAVVYTPNRNANGSDSFTFTVSDGAVTSASASIGIAITPVNDPPIATDETVIVLTGLSTNIALSGTDVESDPLTYIVVNSPLHGTLSGSGSTVSYQSNAGYVGSDSFTYRVNDGTVNSAIATVSISVQAPSSVTTESSSGGGGAITDFWMELMGLLLLIHGVRVVSLSGQAQTVTSRQRSPSGH